MLLCEESIYTNNEIRMKVETVTALAVKVSVPWNVIPGSAVTYAPKFQTNLLPPSS
jgi:hypothetical protein